MFFILVMEFATVKLELTLEAAKLLNAWKLVLPVTTPVRVTTIATLKSPAVVVVHV